MSEFQRYEFMTIDKPLTREQLNEVRKLSGHIEASSTNALIEYQWGNFKHDPIHVLYKFFDGFLYWANWGSPRLAFRFPHGILSVNLIEDYDLEDFITFTPHRDYDILDIHFDDTDAPNEWTEYELSSLIAIRAELMEADLRALYIIWLAGQCKPEGYENEVKENYTIKVPPVPRGLGSLSSTESILADLLQVPQDLLSAVANHSKPLQSDTNDNFPAWIKLLPPNKHDDYLIRLAPNEPGLSSLLIRELRQLNPDRAKESEQKDEYVTYARLNAESKKIRNK